jgi:hypothetical protein
VTVALSYTTNYHLPYMTDQTGLTELAQATQEIAGTFDQVLGQKGYTPPDATTFAALAARVTTVEGTVNRTTPLLRVGGLAATPAQAVAANAVPTTVLLPSIEEDTHTAYNASTGKFTCPTGWGGVYEIVGQILWASQATASGRRYGRVLRTAAGQALNANTPENQRAQTSMIPLATGATYMSIGTFWHRLAPGDSLTMDATQDTTAALNITPAGCALFIRWLRA